MSGQCGAQKLATDAKIRASEHNHDSTGGLFRGALAALLMGAVLAAGAPVASATTVLSCGYLGCTVFILGPHTPNPRSSPHMHFSLLPAAGPAGTSFKATARGFKPGEYVTVWDYSGTRLRHSVEIPGANATRAGALAVTRATIAGITPAGGRKLCLQGERSHRVACATYTVSASATSPTGPGYVAPTTGPGYVPPTTGPGYVPPTTGPGYVAPASS